MLGIPTKLLEHMHTYIHTCWSTWSHFSWGVRAITSGVHQCAGLGRSRRGWMRTTRTARSSRSAASSSSASPTCSPTTSARSTSRRRACTGALSPLTVHNIVLVFYLHTVFVCFRTIGSAINLYNNLFGFRALFSAMEKIVTTGYRALQLQYFFTSGKDEVRGTFSSLLVHS